MYYLYYEPISIWKRIAETTTWIFLLMLIPLSALGYFAEKSVPGNALYPMKRNIEKLVLKLGSFDKSAQALYQVNLADSRFNEAETLLAANNNSKQLSVLPLEDLTKQIDSAKESINTISDPVEKKKAIDTLINNITTYQNKLGQMQNTYQLPNTPMILQQQNSQHFGFTNQNQNLQTNPQNYPANQPVTQSMNQNIPSTSLNNSAQSPQFDEQTVNTINQAQNTLGQDQTVLQQAKQNLDNGGSGTIPKTAPSSTPSPVQQTQLIISPSPTATLSPTSKPGVTQPAASHVSSSGPTPIPPSPTTTTNATSNDNGDNGNRQSNGNGNGHNANGHSNGQGSGNGNGNGNGD